MIEVDICNSALGWVESPTRIDSLNDQSAEGIVCNQYYHEIRKELLNAYTWSWATLDVKLDRNDYRHSEWPISYDYPTGILRVLRLHHQDADLEMEYAIEMMSASPYKLGIFANVENLYLRGIYDLEDNFPPLFKRFLELSLAESIGKPLKVSQTTMDRISLKRLELMQRAVAVDSSQAKRNEREPTWLQDRMISGKYR